MELFLPKLGTPEDVANFATDPAGCIRTWPSRYGSAVRFEKNDAQTLFVFGADLNHEILTNTDVYHIQSGFPGPKKSSQRRFRAGLFSQNGQTHQKHRRLIAPPFARPEVIGYFDSVAGEIDRQLSNWSPMQTINLAHEMQELTLRLTTSLLFGLPDVEPPWEVAHSFEHWLNLNHAHSFSIWLPYELPESTYRDMLEAAEDLEEKLRSLIRMRQARGGPGRDLLSILLQAQTIGHISEDELIGQLFTLFNASYHTTTYALTWNLFLLAQHPSVASALHADLNHHLGNGPISNQKLEQIPLLDWSIKEGLRILPVIVYMVRVTNQQTKLGPWTLPLGTLVLLCPLGSHHLPEVFADPEKYRPERWRNPPRPYAYIPFGGGPRLCLGAPLATMIVRTAIAKIFKRFRMSVVPGSRIDRMGTLSLEARYGVPVTLVPQDGQFASSPIVGNIQDLVHLPTAIPQKRAA